MKISRSEKKIEAIKRLKAIGIIPDAIKQFEENDTVMVSENPFGFLYTIDDEQAKLVKEFEEEYNALVYLCNLCTTNFGSLFSIFYVSDYPEEWEMDNMDLTEGYAFVNCLNLNAPELSDMGSITFKSINGGVKRIG